MGLVESNSFRIFNCVTSNDPVKNPPYFARVEKVDGNWKAVDTNNQFSGRLIDAKVTTFEHKGNKHLKLVLFFDDNGEKEKLDLTGGIARSVINTFANHKPFGHEVFFRVYEKNGFNNVYIMVDGEQASWKYDANRVRAIQKNDERWIAMFNADVAPAAKEFNIDPFAPAAKEFNPAPSEEKEEEVAVDDDLPF